MTPPSPAGEPIARLAEASVLVIGAGALGCAAADALGAAGARRLTLVDDDRVERSNLHRQLLHRARDLGRPKVASARDALAARHPALATAIAPVRFAADNAAALVRGHACVIDATDGLATKFLVNDLAVGLGAPLVHAGIVRFQGQLMTILPGVSACYRCLFGAPPPEGSVPSCQEAGVLGSLAGTIGMLQAAEAIRIVTTGALLADRLLTYDGLTGRFRHVKLRRNPACPTCRHVVAPVAARASNG
ncbi:MAG: HesA/MoeB/ThiF family protein [Deltaproteobacteria bacterium]|nr:HesA/MoeB/ThiF family protein [Deltaproteobacteria bacterium]